MKRIYSVFFAFALLMANSLYAQCTFYGFVENDAGDGYYLKEFDETDMFVVKEIGVVDHEDLDEQLGVSAFREANQTIILGAYEEYIVVINTDDGSYDLHPLYENEEDDEVNIVGLFMDNLNDVLYGIIMNFDQEETQLVEINPENGNTRLIGAIADLEEPMGYGELPAGAYDRHSNRIYLVGMNDEDEQALYVINPDDASSVTVKTDKEIIEAIFADDKTGDVFLLQGLESDPFQFVFHKIDKGDLTFEEDFRLTPDGLFVNEIGASFNFHSKNLVIGGWESPSEVFHVINIETQEFTAKGLEISDFPTLIVHGNCGVPTSVSVPALVGAISYNNPASGILNIKSEDVSAGELVLYNSVLQPVYKSVLENGEASVATGGFKPGMYFFRIMGEGKSSEMKKVIIVD
ncbi:T9SS type A sorting domain-containing protein [Cytophagaceae bacterium ABcell3]|nr:T9SS type A sorting domain-containing protein [Cytophagaceae bacterium ABcell3]